MFIFLGLILIVLFQNCLLQQEEYLPSGNLALQSSFDVNRSLNSSSVSISYSQNNDDVNRPSLAMSISQNENDDDRDRIVGFLDDVEYNSSVAESNAPPADIVTLGVQDNNPDDGINILDDSDKFYWIFLYGFEFLGGVETTEPKTTVSFSSNGKGQINGYVIGFKTRADGSFKNTVFTQYFQFYIGDCSPIQLNMKSESEVSQGSTSIFAIEALENESVKSVSNIRWRIIYGQRIENDWNWVGDYGEVVEANKMRLTADDLTDLSEITLGVTATSENRICQYYKQQTFSISNRTQGQR